MKKVSFKTCCKNTKPKNENIKKLSFSDRFFNKKERSYSQTKALNVAERLHQELQDNIKYNKRHKKETLAEYLLMKYKMYYQINKVYRLSDLSLNLLIKRLLI